MYKFQYYDLGKFQNIILSNRTHGGTIHESIGKTGKMQRMWTV